MIKYEILMLRKISKRFGFKYIEPIEIYSYRPYLFEIENYIASICTDNVINIWKKEDILNLNEERNLVHQFITNKSQLISLIPYKGNKLISVSKDGMIIIFNLDYGLEIKSFVSTKFEKSPDKIAPEWSDIIHYLFQVSNTYKSNLDILYLFYDEGTIISFNLNNNYYESKVVLEKFQRYISIKDNIVMYEKERNKNVYVYNVITNKEICIEFKNRKNNYPKNFVKVSDNLIFYHTDTKIVLFDIYSKSIIHTFEEASIKSLEKPLKVSEDKVIFFDKDSNLIIECNIKDKIIDYAYINSKNIDYWYKIDNKLIIFDSDKFFLIVDLDTWKVINKKHESDLNKYSYGELGLINENIMYFSNEINKSYILNIEEKRIIKEFKKDNIISVNKELLLYKDEDNIVVFDSILEKEILFLKPEFIPINIFKISNSLIAYSSKEEIIFFDTKSNSEKRLELSALDYELISEEIDRFIEINKNEIVIVSSKSIFTIYNFVSKSELITFLLRYGEDLKQITHDKNLIKISTNSEEKIIDLDSVKEKSILI